MNRYNSNNLKNLTTIMKDSETLMQRMMERKKQKEKEKKEQKENKSMTQKGDDNKMTNRQLMRSDQINSEQQQ